MASNEQEQMFITCEVCDLPFRSIKTFEQHMKGKKHKKEVEDQKRQVKSLDGDSCLDETEDSKDYTCGLCEIAFSGIIPYKQHLKSKHHAKIIRKKQAEDDSALLENASSDSELLDEGDADLNEMAKKILPEPYGSCVICDKQFSGPESYSQHLKSESHKKRKCEIKLLKRIKALLSIGDSSDSEEDKKEEKELKCKTCDKVFGNTVYFAQHFTSRAHKKRESQNQLLENLKDMMQLDDDSSSSEDEESPGVLTCKICKLEFSGPEYMKAHIDSKKHKKLLKWKKYLAKTDKSTEEGSRAEANLKNKADTGKASDEKETDCPAKSESSSESD